MVATQQCQTTRIFRRPRSIDSCATTPSPGAPPRPLEQHALPVLHTLWHRNRNIRHPLEGYRNRCCRAIRRRSRRIPTEAPTPRIAATNTSNTTKSKASIFWGVWSGTFDTCFGCSTRLCSYILVDAKQYISAKCRFVENRLWSLGQIWINQSNLLINCQTLRLTSDKQSGDQLLSTPTYQW